MSRRYQPVCGDVALDQPEIEDRLAAIAVYTVVNDANEFVLVSGPGAGAAPQKQLGLFFLGEEGAQGLLQEISRQDPSLASSCRCVEHRGGGQC